MNNYWKSSIKPLGVLLRGFYIPVVHELTGNVGLAIYEEKLMISLDEIGRIIQEAIALENISY